LAEDLSKPDFRFLEQTFPLETAFITIEP
jgi:hypothetical protein